MRIRRDKDTIWIARENPALEAELDKLYVRVRGFLRWKVDTPETPIRDFIRAVTSGSVDDETYETRIRSCMQCPALIKNRKGIFCGGCSCGTWPVAQLDGSILPKLRFVKLKCPLGRPGFHGSST